MNHFYQADPSGTPYGNQTQTASRREAEYMHTSYRGTPYPGSTPYCRQETFVAERRTSPSAMSVIGMVFGIISLLLSFIPFFGTAIAILSIVLCSVARKGNDSTRFALVGLITSAAAILLNLVITVLLFTVLRNFWDLLVGWIPYM